MIIAVLEFGDYLFLTIIIALLLAASRSTGKAAAQERLRRIEDKLNVLMNHLNIDYVPHSKDRWQRLADDGDMDDAIAEYTQSHSVSEEEAKLVVEQYIADGKRTQ